MAQQSPQRRLTKFPSGAPSSSDPHQTFLPGRYTSEYLPQEINLIIGFLPVMGALVTLVCAGLAFKTACMWEKWPSAVPDAPTVLTTAPHVRVCLAHRG